MTTLGIAAGYTLLIAQIADPLPMEPIERYGAMSLLGLLIWFLTTQLYKKVDEVASMQREMLVLQRQQNEILSKLAEKQ